MLFTICNQQDASAVISTKGAEMQAFRIGEQDYLWQGDPRIWDEHAPILFPVVCTPKDGKMAHDGVEYPMPKHGFAKECEFRTVLQTAGSIVMELTESPETLSQFPFHFRLTVSYTIDKAGFSAAFTVHNCGTKPMTYCIGGHPGFRCPLCEGEDLSDYRLEFPAWEGASLTGTDNGLMRPDLPSWNEKMQKNILPLSYDIFEDDTFIFQNLPVSQVKLISNKTGAGIQLDFDGFSALGVWTSAKEGMRAPFLCLEPWNGLPASSDETTDAKSKKYAKVLNPGGSHTVGYRVTVIKKA